MISKTIFNISCKTKITPKLVSFFKNSLRMIRFTKMSSKSFHNQIIKFICITGTTAVTIRHLTTNSISSAKKPETLVSVQMFSRHGARTPLYLVNGIEEVLHLMFWVCLSISFNVRNLIYRLSTLLAYWNLTSRLNTLSKHYKTKTCVQKQRLTTISWTWIENLEGALLWVN